MKYERVTTENAVKYVFYFNKLLPTQQQTFMNKNH